MMTSLLADTSVIVKFKIVTNFMNELINPTCNSLLATFFELSFDTCQKKVSSCLKTVVRPKRTLGQLFKLLFPLPLLTSPKKTLLERCEKKPVGGPEGPNEVSGVCETEAATEGDVEDADEDVDVDGDVEEAGVTGYESEGFRFSEILRRKKLAKRNVLEVVVDTAQLPQCEFSNLQHQSLNFLKEFLCWPVIEFY